MNVMVACFWFSVAGLIYSYLGYPALLWVWARRRPQTDRAGEATPHLSVVIVACNEAHQIERRLENILTQDYPRDRLEVIVVSDGSQDDTAARARGVGAAAVRVIEFADRRGKSAVLDEVVPSARGEIVVLADARQRFAAGALRALATHFCDPDVGAVGGELILTDGPEGAELSRGVDAYWRYEKFIRRKESLIDSTVGASGAIYALRRVLFRGIPENTILDDVLIPLGIARQGYRVLFEPRALAYDHITPSARVEFRRKVRTLAGNFQLFVNTHWLWSPRANRLWVQLLSHKLCRLLCPWFMLVALLANAGLVDRPLYSVLFAVQLLFYGAALSGRLTRRAKRRPPVFNIPYTFCVLNWAAVMGLFELLGGRQSAAWTVTSMQTAGASSVSDHMNRHRQ